MKRTRNTYLPHLNNDDKNFKDKLLIAISLLVILVLLVYIYISNFISLYEVTREPAISKQTTLARYEYDDIQKKLNDAKSQMAQIDRETLEKNKNNKDLDSLYDSVINLNNLRNDFSLSLKNSLDSKGFLKENENYIFINNGNLVLHDLLLFNEGSNELTDNAKKGIELLSLGLEQLLSNPSISNFIKYVSIESYVDSTELDSATKTDASRKADNFLNQLLSVNSNLKDKYSNKFISSNCYNNISLNQDKISDSRIEICVYIDDAAIYSAIEPYVGTSAE